MDDAILQAFKAQLLSRQQKLEIQLAATGEDSKPVELDQQSVGRLSRMDAMQVQAMALESKRRKEAELKRIQAALKRFAENEYGYCVSCGEEISEGRLQLDPSVASCIKCAG